jgi:uncharacterized protein YutE (UPF0331/DUF86 family)
MNRIEDKTEEIQNYLEDLESILPTNLEDYKRNIEKKAACERYFEKIVESVIDLSFLIIKEERFVVPEENNVFEVLYENKIIGEDIFNRMKKAKGMRNVIAQRYGEVDNELVFESVTEELIEDVENFLNEVEKFFGKYK